MNDALMVLFFFVVGLEVNRELVLGELSNPKKAAFPSVAALGGMIVPTLIYAALNIGGEGSAGWGIPMATDIAFALGVLTLFGSRVHPSLKVFLLSLAVADDIGAIVVIALFYTSDLNPVALLIAAGLLGAIVFLRAVGIVWIPIYVLVGVGVWLATFESGVHTTIAGVALGLMTPVQPLRARDPTAPHAGGARRRRRGIRSRKVRVWPLRPCSVSPSVPRARSYIPGRASSSFPSSPWPMPAWSYGGRNWDAMSSPVTLGVLAGLVVGKVVGITVFAYAAQKLGFAEVPEGVAPSQFLGAAAIAGIGFTVSLFITELAFDEASIVDEAKVGILAASMLAALVGALGPAIYRALRRGERRGRARPDPKTRGGLGRTRKHGGGLGRTRKHGRGLGRTRKQLSQGRGKINE